MTCGVYLITCTATGDQYVGRSANLEARWKGHQKSLTIGRHQNANMQALANKYGAESFTFKVLDNNEEEEYTWIRKLQPTLNGVGTERARAKLIELRRVARVLRETEPEFRRQQAITSAIEGAIAALEKHEEFITPRQRQQLRRIAGGDGL